jgi:hypothetical protein
MARRKLTSARANAPVPKSHATGLVPRDYSTHPVGCYAMAPAFPESELVPESEWADRLAENRKNKSGLLDLRTDHYDVLKSLDQDGLGLCHTADTEVLTEKGWVAWPEYNYSDLLATVSPASGLLEFQAPFQRHVYPYDGEMVHSTNRRLDFGVTPDHRMLVRKWDERRRTLSDRYTFQRAGEIGWYAGLMAAPVGFVGTELKRIAIPGDREYDGDDFVALLALVTSDGYAGGAEGVRPGKGTRSLVSFAAFREDRRETTAALAARLGFREAPSRPGVWNRWDAGALAEWVRTNCYTGGGLGAQRKRVPDIIKVLTGRQIRHFLDFFGDRSYGSQAFFYSTSRRMIDDLQELHLRIGKRGTICTNEPRRALMPQGTYSDCKGSFTLVVGDVDRLCIDRKKHIVTDRYKGPVYCAAVPNGTLVTRRNGSVLISGNCWAFSSTKACMYTRALAGEPPLRLSAWYVAGKIKGWRDEGGWGAASLEFIAQSGVPVLDLCPKYSHSYDTEAAAANGAFHKFSEWWDGSDNPSVAQKQLVSMLLKRRPCVVDLNDMGHSMCAIDIDSLSPLRIVYDNSWGEQGDRGLYVGQGARARPDGLVVPRVVTPSQT